MTETSSLPTYANPFSPAVPCLTYDLKTDGLSDNVFATEMLTICSLVARAGGTEEEQVQAMADRMVEYARECMFQRRRVSPFESTFPSLSVESQCTDASE